MATKYENLPGVSANYIDGTYLSLSQVTAGQSIMLMASAEKGLSGVPFLAQDMGAVSSEFGSDTPLTNLAAQIADTDTANILLTRIGGKQSHLLIEKPISGSSEMEVVLRISPRERGDAAIFDKLRVAFQAIEADGLLRQRVVIFDADSEVVVFDSEEILSTDDTLFEVELNEDIGELLISDPASYTAPTTKDEVEADAAKDIRNLYTISELPLLSDLLTAATLSNHATYIPDVYAASTFSTTDASIKGILGASGESMTHCERFAAVETAYADLEDAGMDYVFCDGCYADVKTIPASGLTSSEFARWDNQYLGTAHKVVVGGQPYVTMFASPDPFNADHVAATTITSSKTVNTGSFGTDVEVKAHADSRELGLLLSLHDIRIQHGASVSVEEYVDVDGRIKVNVSAPLTASTTGVVLANGSFSAGTLTIAGFTISTKAFDLKMPEVDIALAGKEYASEAALITDYTTSVDLSLDLRNLFTLNGGAAGTHSVEKAVLTHHKLTGELVPEEVFDSLVKVVDGTYRLHEDAFAREVNFAHQAASLAHTSSTEYKSAIAVVPTTRPRGGLRQLARWAGKAPVYAIDSNGDLVVETNGTGFMSTKALYGASDYRPADSGIGLAYGGLVKNTADFGIDSANEAVDSRGIPVDLGKHLIVVGAYGVVSVAGSGRTPTFAVSNLGPKIIQKLTQLPINEEPIGPVNGLIDGVSATGAINSRALLNDLAIGRVVMLASDGSIANIRTAALPTSDYARVSTVRAANAVCTAVRDISLRYLGKSFSDAQLAALDAELAGTMRALKVDGSIQDGVVQTSASRLDRINGRLNLKVQFVPPLAIEAITIDLTVSAPQA